MNTRGHTLEIEGRKEDIFKNQGEIEKDKKFKRWEHMWKIGKEDPAYI